MVITEVGMDKHFIAVMPHMIEPLASMGITVADHTLYLTVTPEGALRIIPVRGPNAEGEQNEWDKASRRRAFLSILHLPNLFSGEF